MHAPLPYIVIRIKNNREPHGLVIDVSSPKQIIFSPNNAMNWGTGSAANRADGVSGWSWLWIAIETFGLTL